MTETIRNIKAFLQHHIKIMKHIKKVLAGNLQKKKLSYEISLTINS